MATANLQAASPAVEGEQTQRFQALLVQARTAHDTEDYPQAIRLYEQARDLIPAGRARAARDGINRTVRHLRKLHASVCRCGTDRPAECHVHAPGDNRGIAAWVKAGMPNGFPLPATCAICGASGLLYPDVDRDDPNSGADAHGHRPTLVCPRCSTPAVERQLAGDAARFGYALNSRRVFDLWRF